MSREFRSCARYRSATGACGLARPRPSSAFSTTLLLPVRYLACPAAQCGSAVNSSGGKVVRRRMKLDQFVTGPNRTALRDGELLLAIECDALPEFGGSFEK